MRHGRMRAGAILGAMLALGAVRAEAQAPMPRPEINFYGMSGLIDMPTAQVQPDGQVTGSFSYFGAMTRRSFSFQALPRLSVALRYSTIDNWGRPNDPGYDLFDRSFDLQFQLLDEDPAGWRPGLAIGGRDILGTGVYSSEYIVASKTVGRDFTLTAGVGWGRLAGVNTASNPFCSAADRLCTRDEDYGDGGELSTGRFFRGEDVGFFGGIAWRTPIERLTLKAEYSSDAYEREQSGAAAKFERKSEVNFGAEYKVNDGFLIGGYYLYGSEIGVNVVLSGNPNRPPVPQNLGRGPIPLMARAGSARGDWAASPQARAALGEGIAKALSEEGIGLERAAFAPQTVEVAITNRRINQMPKAVGRTARILAAGLPASVRTFRVTIIESGLPVSTVEIDRAALERQVNRPRAGVLNWQSVTLSDAHPAAAGDWDRGAYPKFSWSLVPAPSFRVFGNRHGFRPQLTADLSGRVRMSPRLSFSARLSQPLLGSFDEPERGPGRSRGLPNVRRDSVEYYSGTNPKLMHATGDYLFKLAPSVFGRASAGYLERQFAGVSGEVLWKPVNSSLGYGVELSYARQRDPDSFLGLNDYDVVTGHGSLYWTTGFRGIEAQVDVGRYLAGDWGATLTLSRRFANGWEVGAFATKTDVSSDDFGEGSFDKGIVLTIPLRWATPFETRQSNTVTLRSLASDGGARLNVRNRLYPVVRDADRDHLEDNWGAFWQ